METLKTWYSLYHTFENFMVHKVMHFVVGGLLGLTAHVSLIVAIVLVLFAAIGKEVYDYKELKKDPTNPLNELKYHTLDVIVTCLGGVVGILVGTGVLAHVV